MSTNILWKIQQYKMFYIVYYFLVKALTYAQSNICLSWEKLKFKSTEKEITSKRKNDIKKHQRF